MIFAKLIVILFIAICIMFFILGLISQKGKAKGIQENGQLADPPSAPNTVSSEDDVQPEKKVAPINGGFEQIKNAISATGGVITAESKDYISATYMSKVFKFVDDVELRHTHDDVWHIRSASRVGYSDRGVNRKRVEAIRAAVEANQ